MADETESTNISPSVQALLQRYASRLAAITSAAIQTAIDEWASTEGGPKGLAGEPTLAEYIAARLVESDTKVASDG